MLLDNKYVYQPFWNYYNKINGFENWQESFKACKHAANKALANKDTAAVLSIIFYRLYTLRNQLIHGGATFNSSANRSQLKDATNVLGDIVPIVIALMMDNTNELWGDGLRNRTAVIGQLLDRYNLKFRAHYRPTV